MNVDTALQLLGGRNTYIAVWYSIICFVKGASSCFALLSFLWANAKPTSFHCKIPDGYILNQSIPYEYKDGKQTLSQCRQYLNFSSSQNKTVPCQHGYVYEGYMKTSVVYEWNLVCDREYLGAFADSSFFILSVFASSIFTALADRFGRRIVFIVCLLALSIIGFLLTFSPNVYVYIFLRLLLGPLQQGTFSVGYCYGMELFPVKRRTVPVLLGEVFWVVASLILCFIAYFVRDWRLYYYVTNLPFLCGILLFFFMPESIPWLVARGRVDEAKKVLLTAARFSSDSNYVEERIKLEPLINNDNISEAEENSSDKNIYPCYFICIRKHLRQWTFTNVILWTTIGCVYYAFQVKGSTFGNVYLNFFIISIAETPSIVFLTLVSRKIGRKVILFASYFTTSTSYIILFCLAKFVPSSTNVINIWFIICGRLFTGTIFNLLFLHAGEMYPTSLRSMGVAAGTSSARLGVALTPFLVMLKNVAFWLPGVIIVIACYICALLSLGLPETRKWPLPQTLVDIHVFRNDPRYRSTFCKSCKKSSTAED